MSNRTPGKFRLTVRKHPREPVKDLCFETLEELCSAAQRYSVNLRHYPVSLDGWDLDWYAPVLVAFSPNGKPMPVDELAAYGRRLRRGTRYERGDGPVPRTGKFRGGWARRSPQTTAARRSAQAFEDEIPPRPARGMRGLPTTYDDLVITLQRSWKVHGRRRKAWDRPDRVRLAGP